MRPTGLSLHHAAVIVCINEDWEAFEKIFRQIQLIPEAAGPGGIREAIELFVLSGDLPTTGRAPRVHAVSADGWWLAARGRHIYAGREGYVFPLPVYDRGSRTKTTLRTLQREGVEIGPMIKREYMRLGEEIYG